MLGGSGAWPTPEQACSGYLVESDGFTLLIDPGYATMPELARRVPVELVDAVFVSHGHPDHCADLNPLLRARALRDDPPTRLPVYAPTGALDPVLRLDRPGMLADSLLVREFRPGDSFECGPFRMETRALPHFVPNAGLRLSDDESTVAYTGDSGPCDEVISLAGDADLLLAEATFIDQVPTDSASYLTSARQAGAQATRAGVGHLVLTHLWPGTDPGQAKAAARETFAGPIDVAQPSLTLTFSTGGWTTE